MAVSYTIDFDAFIEDIIQKIRLNKQLTLPLSDLEKLIYQLKNFELGRSLLSLSNLNSDWVDYICHNESSPTKDGLETWILTKSPRIKAIRECYHITRNLIQRHLRSNMSLCIAPCGGISKLVELDYASINDIHIVGYDTNIQSLIKAELKMETLVNTGKVHLSLYKKDVWLIEDHNQYDLIASSRLSVLESNQNKLLDLFTKCYKALKLNGIFISSFFTPSPLKNKKESPWVNVNQEDMLMEHAIFNDIMGSKLVERTEKEILRLFQNAGFEVLNIYYDTQKIYPVIVAQKL